MDVVPSAYGSGVAEPPGNPVDRLNDVRLLVLHEPCGPDLAERLGGEHRAGPGAEVLRGHAGSRDVPQVLVHVPGVHVLAVPEIVQVLKELLAR